MASPREGPNPLRPYYRPPSIGVTPETLPDSSASAALKPIKPPSGFAFPDLNYRDYISDASPSVTASVKSTIDKAIWKYTTVLLAQPFEVAKLILQVHVAEDEEVDGRDRDQGRRPDLDRDDVEDEYNDPSDDEPNFFSTSASFVQPSTYGSPGRGRQGRPRRQASNRANYPSTNPTSPPPYRVQLNNPHSLLDALSALSSNSGALALWRGTNTTFVYSILLRTLEGFFRGLLAAIFGIADSDIFVPSTTGAIPSPSILTAGSPLASVLVVTAATALSSLILSPIDAARTRLILTSSSQPPRTLLATLRTLSPPYLIPAHLIPITFLSSSLPALVSSYSPIFLKLYLNIDPVLNPSSWSIASFFASALDLTLKYPLETVLRRAQIVTWTSPKYSPPPSKSSRKVIETIVPVPQTYRGILPTMYEIVREEGSCTSPKDETVKATGRPLVRRKGQGIEGLYRGWRLGLWCLVGVWSADMIGGLQGAAEPATEGVAAHARKF